MARHRAKGLGATDLFNNVKVRKPKGGLIVAKRVFLIRHFGSKLSPSILVKKLMSSRGQSLVVSRRGKVLMASGTYLNPRCDERCFSMDRPMSCKTMEPGLRHSVSRSCREGN